MKIQNVQILALLMLLSLPLACADWLFHRGSLGSLRVKSARVWIESWVEGLILVLALEASRSGKGSHNFRVSCRTAHVSLGLKYRRLDEDLFVAEKGRVAANDALGSLAR